MRMPDSRRRLDKWKPMNHAAPVTRMVFEADEVMLYILCVVRDKIDYAQILEKISIGLITHINHTSISPTH